MIEHLRERDKALEPLGWTGREAEWIALVCLHSGVFIRSQFCRYFAAHRQIAARMVQGLKEQKALVESEHVISTEAGGRAGFQARRSTGLWGSRTSGTGGVPAPCLSCGGFSRLITSWNIPA